MLLCRPAWLVQGVEEPFSFLAPGDAGDVQFVNRFDLACPFDDPGSAADAVQDHFGGAAIVVQVWVPA